MWHGSGFRLTRTVGLILTLLYIVYAFHNILLVWVLDICGWNDAAEHWLLCNETSKRKNLRTLARLRAARSCSHPQITRRIYFRRSITATAERSAPNAHHRASGAYASTVPCRARTITVPSVVCGSA